MGTENRNYDEAARRRRQKSKRRAARRRRAIRNRIIFGVAAAVLLLMIILGVRAIGKKLFGHGKAPETIQAEMADSNDNTIDNNIDNNGNRVSEGEGVQEGAPAGNGRLSLSGESTETPVLFSGYEPVFSDATQGINNTEVNSTFGILVDLDTGAVVASRNGRDTMYPASMTKIMTVLVAAEHIKSNEEFNKEIPITQDITDYVFKNGCSAVNFSINEEIPIRDLFYGTILPSGADAALALAIYTAGSESAFVDLMNQKCAELGLKNTHFTNCVGTYNDDHYSTCADMAMIMKAAVENDIARDALSLHRYTTVKTLDHPDGIELSNWFLRKIEDKDCHGTVVAAKTGYVVQSGNCAASYTVSNSGKNYVCVTGHAHSSWRCIYDHVAIYDDFIN